MMTRTWRENSRIFTLRHDFLMLGLRRLQGVQLVRKGVTTRDLPGSRRALSMHSFEREGSTLRLHQTCPLVP